MNLEHTKIENYKTQAEATTNLASKQHRTQSLLTEAINYWLSGALVFAHAIACVEIVLSRSDKACPIYREIVQAWGLPGFQNILEATWPHMPNSAGLLIESIEANKKNKEQSHGEFMDDLKILEEMWSEKLDKSNKY